MKLEKIILIAIVCLVSFLTLYKIDVNPPGLYIDEISIGQNAYKILTTGKDEYGIPHPLWFKSFGDYKMPVYIYSVAGAMAIFGKNEFAVRFPSALAGILSVLVLYFFVKNLLELDKSFAAPYKKYLPLLSALLLALSSWHIHFSRGGFEVNLGVLWYLLGALCFLMFVKKKKGYYLFVGITFFLLSMYTYHSFRMTTPVTVVLSLFYFFRKDVVFRGDSIIALVIFILFCLPIFQFSFTKEGSERFAQTSAFIEYKTDTIFEKLAVYPLVYIKNFLSFFSFNFLFTNGDGNGRHQVATFGLFYLWEFIFLLAGLHALIRRKKTVVFYILFGMILLAVMPAALSRPSPHSLRPLLMVAPFMVLIALGIFEFVSSIKRYRPAIILLIIVIGVFELLYIAHFYSHHYTKINLLDWGAGYKDVVTQSVAVKDKYALIVIDNKFSEIKTYYDFYAEDTPVAFVDASWKKPKSLGSKKVLYIRPYYGNKDELQVVKNIRFPNVNNDIFAQFWVL